MIQSRWNVKCWVDWSPPNLADIFDLFQLRGQHIGLSTLKFLTCRRPFVPRPIAVREKSLIFHQNCVICVDHNWSYTSQVLITFERSWSAHSFEQIKMSWFLAGSIIYQIKILNHIQYGILDFNLEFLIQFRMGFHYSFTRTPWKVKELTHNLDFRPSLPFCCNRL